MSEMEKSGKSRTGRGTVYTGEGFQGKKTNAARRGSRQAQKATVNRPKRRIDELREQEIQAKQEAEKQAELERQQAEAERLKAEKQAEAERQKQEKLAAQEKQKQEKLAKQAEAERLKAAKQAEAERQKAAKQAEAERLKAAKQAEAERQKQEKLAAQEKKKQEKAAEKTSEKAAAKPTAPEKPKQENTYVRRSAQLAAGTLATEKLAEPVQPRKPLNVKKLIIGILAGIFVIAYTGFAIYFGMHFYEGTVIYGIDCSKKTLEEVKADVRSKLSTYKLDVLEREDKKEVIIASDVKLEFDDDGSIDQLLKNQKSFIWPVTLLMQKSKGDTVSFSYDRAAALDRIDNLLCMDASHMVAPHDAYITPTDTGFEVAAEVMGTTLDREKTEDVILEALDTGRTEVSLEDSNCYINPEVYQDNEDLQQVASAKNELAGAKITLDFGEEKEVIDSKMIDKWIVQMNNGDYVIDDVLVMDYVESLAERYDTYGIPVEFYTTIGTVETLYGGDYGWEMDQGEMVRSILNALSNNYRGDMDPIYTHVGMSHQNNGIGYTYVEICISRQEMWCYENGELIVDTPVVTGNPNRGNATPSGGVWAVDAKQRNAILVGEGYRAPVDYWIPFNGGVGIHDLQSRYYFGGSIYLYNGSHGCVNTPYSEVQLIYNTVSVGTPVIVYE